MQWSLEAIEQILELYKQQRILWDSKHPKYNNKKARDEVFQWIASQLDTLPNTTTGQDICRKMKTMRAAYQVEIRNINAAKQRGFFYNPTLKWFNAYKNCMDEIESMKYVQDHDSDEISLEEEMDMPNTYKLKFKNRTFKRKYKKSPLQHISAPSVSDEVGILLDQHLSSPLREEHYSDDSMDEFQLFADHIAEQLRSMPRSSRVNHLENQILHVFSRDRERNNPNIM